MIALFRELLMISDFIAKWEIAINIGKLSN